jgi:hypothetical protein
MLWEEGSQMRRHWLLAACVLQCSDTGGSFLYLFTYKMWIIRLFSAHL